MTQTSANHGTPAEDLWLTDSPHHLSSSLNYDLFERDIFFPGNSPEDHTWTDGSLSQYSLLLQGTEHSPLALTNGLDYGNGEMGLGDSFTDYTLYPAGHTPDPQRIPTYDCNDYSPTAPNEYYYNQAEVQAEDVSPDNTSHQTTSHHTTVQIAGGRTGQVHICRRCKRECSTRTNLRRHERTVHKRPTPCCYCQKPIKNRPDYRAKHAKVCKSQPRASLKGKDKLST
ncbi:hypothetical protein BDD12DRAFT_873105 [Trichophaea hybrida]|nr:hypothetical protein BDD12DRAFT_873105 [Trichophaea hybrida]